MLIVNKEGSHPITCTTRIKYLFSVTPVGNPRSDCDARTVKISPIPTSNWNLYLNEVEIPLPLWGPIRS